MRAIGDRLRAMFVEQQFGRMVDVLLEHLHEDVIPGLTVRSGSTGNDLLIDVPSREPLDNRMVTVSLQERKNDGALSGVPIAIS